MKWSYGALRSPEDLPDTTGKLTSITLQAEPAASASIPVKPTFTNVDPDDSTLTGSADDDTSSTSQSAGSSTMMVYQANVHRPQITVEHSTIPLSPSDVGVTLCRGRGSRDANTASTSTIKGGSDAGRVGAGALHVGAWTITYGTSTSSQQRTSPP